MNLTEISPGLVIQGFTPPLALANFKLIAFDMDSTLINIECIDEIADAVGLKAEVAAITEATMRGEIADFKTSLRRRVALLNGVSVASMERVYAERLQLNPGAARLGIDYAKSNQLEALNGVLTGRLLDQPWGDICDGEEKRKTLLETCTLLGIQPSQAIAMGDGANDLPMMGACSDAGGLSVAYHAKPKVREQAMVAINAGGLDRLLEVLV